MGGMECDTSNLLQLVAKELDETLFVLVIAQEVFFLGLDNH